jgi:hypothetical protein
MTIAACWSAAQAAAGSPTLLLDQVIISSVSEVFSALFWLSPTDCKSCRQQCRSQK